MKERSTIDILDSFIEYSESTKKYADAGALRRVKDEFLKLRLEREALMVMKDVIDYKFASGNSVPVERIVITRQEWIDEQWENRLLGASEEHVKDGVL